jgi:hypothetical protein
VLAYVAGSIVPVVRLIADRLRGRPFTAISGLVVVFLVVSVGLALITQDARAAIARGGLIFLAIAIAAAVSVATRSPLMLSLSGYFAVSARPDEAARFARAAGHARGHPRLGARVRGRCPARPPPRTPETGPARRRTGTLTAAGPS